MCPGL